MSQPYNILPPKLADRIAKTSYYNKKGKVRWWNGKQLRNPEYRKEYYKANNEKIKEKTKEYYKANKEYYKEYNKEYKKENKEKIKEQRKEYQKENKEKIKEYQKEYKAANKEKNKEYYKEYYKENKEKIKEYNKEYKANPANKEKINKRTRVRYKNDENFRLSKLLRTRFTLALKSQNIKKNSHVLELTSCPIDFLKDYLSKKFEEGMTWDNQGEWHIDHRKPCASFDLTNKEDQRKCFHYTNLQPLWGKENREKSATFNEATFEYKWVEKKGWVLLTEIENIS